jgi:luciferase family oxidoreductase group 1
MPVLSVLDPSPLFEGHTAERAFKESIVLAEALDGKGFRSFWVGEHHNTKSFAGCAPEVLLAALTQRTRHFMLGSGGVMLPNYSPLKVAEQFCTLAALAPGRIELGIGRATGADPRASAALLGPGADAFPTMLRLLMDWLLDASGEVPIGADHRARGVHVGAIGARPDVWMLCSSPGSAAFAGAMGLKLAFADFLSPGGAAAALSAYRQSFQPSPFSAAPYCAVALAALAAETDAEAQRLADPLRAWTAARLAGEFRAFPSGLGAPSSQVAVQTLAAGHGIVGAAKDVAARLNAISAETSADEIFLLSIAEALSDRVKSYELVSRAN